MAHYRTMMQRGSWRPEHTALIPVRVVAADPGVGLNGTVACKRCGFQKKSYIQCPECTTKSKRRSRG